MMSFNAGFAEVDITPPPGTKKGGWMEDLEAQVFLDPIFAKIAVFDDGTTKVAFIALDLLSVRWSDVDDLRKRISDEYGFPGANIMVSATHNHAGPAIARLTPVDKQVVYLEDLKIKCVDSFGVALKDMKEASVGYGSGKVFDVGFNRRTVLRDGTTRTHGSFSAPDALFVEGPVDPEVAVMMFIDYDGNELGVIVNYACHPTHHGGTDEISAGFPGVLSEKMRSDGWPVALFLNGAYGNVATSDHRLDITVSMEEAGERLFKAVVGTREDMVFNDYCELSSVSETLRLPYRNITDDEYSGKARGAQRFRSDELYEGEIDILMEKIKKQGNQPAEVQVLRLGDFCFAGIPAEYFVEHQLRIKTETHPKRSFVVGGANGMVGYVPTKEAFKRGGYETTLGPPSHMAPEAGDILADKAIELINKIT